MARIGDTACDRFVIPVLHTPVFVVVEWIPMRTGPVGALTSGNRRSIDRVRIDVKMARSPVGMTFQCVTCAIVLVMSWSTCARDLENGKQTGPASRNLAPNRAVFLDSFDDIPGVQPITEIVPLCTTSFPLPFPPLLTSHRPVSGLNLVPDVIISSPEK